VTEFILLCRASGNNEVIRKVTLSSLYLSPLMPSGVDTSGNNEVIRKVTLSSPYLSPLMPSGVELQAIMKLSLKSPCLHPIFHPSSPLVSPSPIIIITSFSSTTTSKVRKLHLKFTWVLKDRVKKGCHWTSME